MEKVGFKFTKQLLDKIKEYPANEEIKVIAGKTLTKSNKWWKAVLLVELGFGDRKQYQIRLYGWKKNQQGEYKVKQKFNVSSALYLGELINIFYAFAEDTGKIKALNRIHEKLIERINELERIKAHLEKQKSRVPTLKKKIGEFKKMIDSEDIDERKLQEFLKKEPWMFGTDYTNIIKSERTLTITSRNDFLIKRFDGYFDILELKSPKHELFTGSTRRALSNHLKNAISQVIKYLAQARTYYLSIKEQTGLDVYFLKGIIVMGRRKEKDKQLLRIHNEYLSNIEIWTYDDLLDKAKKPLKYINMAKEGKHDSSSKYTYQMEKSETGGDTFLSIWKRITSTREKRWKCSRNWI